MLKQKSSKNPGIQWDSVQDTLSIQRDFPAIQKITKKAVARQIASIYDRLGWLVPLLITHKLFQQQLWLEGIHGMKNYPDLCASNGKRYAMNPSSFGNPSNAGSP